ncbi:helix-turn-helix domain-containing protein [Reichenbachiella sp.]|uniref:helix-turn-helix transcriptional regulator n=1 Tax=Reichenbachiella sp. TaxID=2184521 RepID=UPI003297AB6C
MNSIYFQNRKQDMIEFARQIFTGQVIEQEFFNRLISPVKGKLDHIILKTESNNEKMESMMRKVFKEEIQDHLQNHSRIVNIKEACRMLGDASKDTVIRLEQDNKIKRVNDKPKGRILYERASIDAYIDQLIDGSEHNTYNIKID